MGLRAALRHGIVQVDESVLRDWAALIDEPGTPPLEARMLRPVTRSSQQVLDKLAAAPRFGAVPFDWTLGWNETADRKAGYFVGRSAVPESLDDVILQGPHFTVATPYARQPNPTMRSNKDYTAWDLEALGEWPIPRTNYQRAKPIAGVRRWLSALGRRAREPVLAARLATHGRLVDRPHAACGPASAWSDARSRGAQS